MQSESQPQEMPMQKPECVHETFDMPAAAAHRLGELAASKRLAGPAMIHAVPGSAAIEDGFSTRATRGMLWGSLLGLLLGIGLGAWMADQILFTGSWGGLLPGGRAAVAAFLGLALAGLGTLVGSLLGFGSADSGAAGVPRAHLTAMVRPDLDESD